MWNRKRFNDGLKLKRFQDWDGNKLSNYDLVSIEIHQKMVNEYLERYPDQKARLYIARQQFMIYDLSYKIVRENVERKAGHKVEEDRWAREAEERKQRAKAAKLRIAAQKILDEEKSKNWAIKQARDNIVKFEWKVNFYKQQINILKDRIISVRARITVLSDEFLEKQKGTSLYFALRRDRKKKDKALPELIHKLNQETLRLADSKRNLAEAYRFLGETPKEVIEIPPEIPKTVVVQENIITTKDAPVNRKESNLPTFTATFKTNKDKWANCGRNYTFSNVHLSRLNNPVVIRTGELAHVRLFIKERPDLVVVNGVNVEKDSSSTNNRFWQGIVDYDVARKWRNE